MGARPAQAVKNTCEALDKKAEPAQILDTTLENSTAPKFFLLFMLTCIYETQIISLQNLRKAYFKHKKLYDMR